MAAHPEMNITSVERAEALDVGPAHEKPLIVGFTDSPEDYNFVNPPERLRDFPRAPLMSLLPIGACRVKYCQQCISANAEYFANRRRERGQLA